MWGWESGAGRGRLVEVGWEGEDGREGWEIGAVRGRLGVVGVGLGEWGLEIGVGRLGM